MPVVGALYVAVGLAQPVRGSYTCGWLCLYFVSAHQNGDALRPFEVLLLGSLALFACLLFKPGQHRPRWKFGLSVAALVWAGLHAALEGVRWQLVPAYVLALVFFALAVRTWRAQHSRSDAGWEPSWWRTGARISGAVLALLLIALSAISAAVLPVFELPATHGPYAVGTMTWVVDDTSRAEVITDAPDDHRSVVVRAWFPAEAPPSADRASYMPPGEAAAFAKKYGLPAFVVSHLQLVKPNAFVDVPVAPDEASYPVLLFSHGYNVPPSTYASLLADFASRGFIVFAVNHTYESTASVFPNGRVETFDQAFADRVYEGVWEQIEDLEEQFWAANGAAARRAVVRQIMEVYPMSDLQRRWAEDLSAVIDELVRLDTADTRHPLYDRLDLSRLGAVGHSAGGGAAGQLLLTDDRVRAGVNWDGAQWGDVIDSTLTRPFMRIEAMRDSTAFAPNDLVYPGATQDTLYTLKIDDAGHSAFSDMSYLVPVRYLNQAGAIDPRTATKLTVDYTTAFFRRHLLGADAPLLHDTSLTDPDLRFTVTTGTVKTVRRAAP